MIVFGADTERDLGESAIVMPRVRILESCTVFSQPVSLKHASA